MLRFASSLLSPPLSNGSNQIWRRQSSLWNAGEDLARMIKALSQALHSFSLNTCLAVHKSFPMAQY